MVETTPRERYIGTSLPKVDGAEKVTGAAQFGADIRLPGMLRGTIVRSPHPHANIIRIDTSKAEALPGVHAVVTGADFPIRQFGDVALAGAMRMDIYRLSHLAMARDKVVFAGQPVAAVAAMNVGVARQAANLVDVEYEVLPHIQDEIAAMAPDAPLLHDDLFTNGLGDKPDHPSNVSLKIEMGRGDIAAGESDADVIVERSVKTQGVHQGYIEPEAETAWYKSDGRLTVWANTQGLFGQRAQISGITGIPETSITVVPTEVGGGFGAKNVCRVSPIASLLSRKAGRPVNIALSREEVLRATGPAPATTNWVRAGAKSDGTITFIDARMVYNAGGFPGSPLAGGTLVGFSPYRTENLQIIGYDVVTNKPKVGAYRAPGGPPITFVVESVMDELAEKLGIDKVEFRRINAPVEGDLGPNDLTFNRIGFIDVLEQVKNHSCWTDPLSPPRNGGKVGRGLGVGYWRGGAGTSSVMLSINGSGLVTLVVGSVDLSISRTAWVQIVADELHVPPEEIHVKTGDTDSVGHTDNSGGSRVTYTTGAAVHSACLAAVQILKERAAEKLEVTPGVIDFIDGVFLARDIPDRSIDYKQLARQSSAGGGAISVVGTVTGLPPAPAFAAHVAEVEVDTETGKVNVLRYTAFQDVGKAIHRDGAIGQIQGGVGQGIGWGIHESYVWGEDGTLLNASLLDYRLPTALDVPPIEVVLIEVPATGGPYGVRGAGEVPIIPPPGTLGNAVYDATGVRMDQLPMSPENVRTRLMSAGDDAVRTRWLSADVSASGDEGRGAVAGVDVPNDE